MRALFAILVLLLCLIATRADDPARDQRFGSRSLCRQNVEVRGLVVSVRTSPLGTTFINFGREYPNQTFAGFIAAGSKMENDQRIDTLQGKIIGITGTIEFNQGKPEIKITSTDQIKGLDSLRAQ